MDGKSLDITEDVLSKLKQAVPQAFTDGKLDLEQLRTLLGEEINTDAERYQLSWAGKSEAYKVLQTPTTATLIPQPEDSVNWNEAENIFIEGENLEVLKALQKSYYGKIKMIYIDPPYNTGSDSFIYPDKFSETKEEYLKRIGDKDDAGYMMKEGMFRKNSKENGQFHSNWLNMMLPRLFLGRNLLTDDGILFTSIGDDEQANLKLLLDEIFGEENFLAQFVWRTDGNFDNQARVKSCHEYILAYTKNTNSFPHPPTIDPNTKESSKLFKEFIRNTIVKNGYKNPISEIKLPEGFPADFEKGTIGARDNEYPHYLDDANVVENKLEEEVTVSSGWSSKQLLLKFIENDFNEVLDNKQQKTKFVLTKTGAIESIKKRKENQSHVISVLSGLGNTQSTSSMLQREGIYFDYPKPIPLIKYLISMNEGKDFIALDFFAGSGTLAHSIAEINEEDGGNRKFICVQLPELTDEDSIAFKEGFENISSIAESRIKKILVKIEESRNGKISFETPQKLGYRKYKLAGSNFKIWRGDVIDNEEELKNQMSLFVKPERANALTENILWELLVKSGFPLSGKIERIELGDEASVYITSNKKLAFVLEKYTKEVQEKVLELNPNSVVCLDSLFEGNDKVKTNAQLKFEDSGISFKTV